MAIWFLCGNPGGGKSYCALRFVVRELCEGSRVVVTNLAVREPALREWLAEYHPGVEVDLFTRLRIIPDEWVREFWLHRGFRNGQGVPVAVDLAAGVDARKGAGGGPGSFPDFGPCRDLPGVMYVLDEVHEHFPARYWQETGRQVLHYMSQHRKLGDEVWCVTQHPEQIDRQFRMLAEASLYVTNGAVNKFGYVFKGPSRFVWKKFLGMRSGQQKAIEMGTFTLDRQGLAECYDTAQGVGVAGRLADTVERRRGIPLWVLALLVVFGVVVLSQVPGFLAWVVDWFTGGVGRAARASQSVGVVASPAVVKASAGPLVYDARRGGSDGPVPSVPVVVVPEVFMTGSAAVGGDWVVYLSDGRCVGRDRGLSMLGPEGCVINGHVYRYARPGVASEVRRDVWGR